MNNHKAIIALVAVAVTIVILVAALGRADSQEPAQFAKPQPPPFATLPLYFPPHSGSYQVLPVSAIDGDTCHIYWLVGPYPARLAFIDAPEMRTPEGPPSKAALGAMLTYDRPMRAVVHGRDKFDRVLLDIQDADGKSLSQRLVDAGMAKKWNGQGPKP